MFKVTRAFILAISLTPIALVTTVRADSDTGNNEEALKIMKDHMRSQLDWRSYFTNRMDVRRRARLAGENKQHAPQAASLN